MIRGFLVLSLINCSLCGWLCQAQRRDARRDTEGAVENILDITRGEGLEIGAYALRRIQERGLPVTPKVLHENARALSEEAPLATRWLPIYPAMSNTPAGYSSASQVAAFHLSGQDIALQAFAALAPTASPESRAELEGYYRQPVLQPSCKAPWFDTNLPLIAFLGEHLEAYFPTLDSQVGLLDKLSISTTSPFDLVALLRLIERSDLRQARELGFLLARIVSSLERAYAPVKGTTVLNDAFDLDASLRAFAGRCSGANVDVQPLMLAYRQYLLRIIAQPSCAQVDNSADRRELTARQRLVEKFNHWPGIASDSSVHAIGADDFAQAAKASRLAPEVEPSFEPPAELRQLASKVRRPTGTHAEVSDTLNEFLDRWSKWHPKGEDDDFRWVDTKAVLVLGLITYASPEDRRKITPVAVNYLSRHWIKKSHPALWLTYSAILFSMAGGLSNNTRPIPADIDLVKDIHRANDPALAALARIELLKPLKTP